MLVQVIYTVFSFIYLPVPVAIATNYNVDILFAHYMHGKHFKSMCAA